MEKRMKVINLKIKILLTLCSVFIIALNADNVVLNEKETGDQPQWKQNLKIKGDFRYRNDWKKFDSDNVARVRQRIRLRLNAETSIAPGVNVGFGLATGTDDPRGANQTLENSFDTKTIMLNHAYGSYAFPKYAKLFMGKFYSNLGFWKPTDYMWDTDITVEGLAAMFNHQNLFLNTGLYVLDEKGAVKNIIDDNPYLVLIQPGLSLHKENQYHLKIAATYYHFNQTKDMSFDHAEWTNSHYTVGGVNYLTVGYNNVSLSAEVGVYEKIFPYIGFCFELNQNVQAESDTVNNGVVLGLTFGTKNVREKGQWQVKYLYRRLEKDAWLDFLPDSDTYSGQTDIKGSKLAFQYGLRKNVTFGLNYYHGSNLHGTTKTEQIVQADLLFNF